MSQIKAINNNNNNNNNKIMIKQIFEKWSELMGYLIDNSHGKEFSVFKQVFYFRIMQANPASTFTLYIQSQGLTLSNLALSGKMHSEVVLQLLKFEARIQATGNSQLNVDIVFL